MATPSEEIDSPPSTVKPAPQPNPVPPAWREIIDRPGLMIVMLFFVTAATGLPFLWMSRGFSVVGKIVLTILVLLWTALVLWAFYLVMAWCIPRILEGFRGA